MDRWSGTELNVLAQIVLSGFAKITIATGYSRLNGDAITHLQMSDILAEFRYDAGSLVSKNHGSLDNEIPDSASHPIMHVGSTNSNS